MAKTPKKMEQVIRCALVGLTDHQAGYICNIDEDEFATFYAETFDSHLPVNFMKRRRMRFAKYEHGYKVKDPDNYQDSFTGRIVNSIANQICIHCKNRGIERYGLAFQLLDFTGQELKDHLESKFEDWMTFDNYGSRWEIDHILPVSSFDFKAIDDHAFHQCWSLDNLQPLCKVENKRKGSRLDYVK